MFTKRRSFIIAGLVSISLAATIVAPAVSQAQAVSPQAKGVACEILRSAATVWQEAGETAEAKGEKDMAAYYFGMADKVGGEAGNMGCLWEIEIDATKAPGKGKAIKPPVTAKLTTSGAVMVASAR